MRILQVPVVEHWNLSTEEWMSTKTNGLFFQLSRSLQQRYNNRKMKRANIQCIGICRRYVRRMRMVYKHGDDNNRAHYLTNQAATKQFMSKASVSQGTHKGNFKVIYVLERRRQYDTIIVRPQCFT